MSVRATARFAGGLLVLLTLASCSAHNSPKPNADLGAEGRSQFMSKEDESRLQAVASSRATAGGSAGYRIGPDDLLQVSIPDLVGENDRPARLGDAVGDRFAPPMTGSPEFHDGVRVAGDGNITLPLVGQVHAQGLTPRELEEEIAGRIVSAGLLKDPQVSVTVAEHRSGVVAVIGSVERPGLFPLTRPGATLSDMIWTAGGPNKDAGRIVEFVPVGEGSGGADGTPIRIDLERLLSRTTQRANVVDPPARPGDTINIAPAGNVQVQGWVEKPGSYPITRKLTLTGAIAAAGGTQFAADKSRATIRRMRGSGEESYVVDLSAVSRGEALDLVVADGDVVDLPASKTRVVPWALWSAIKQMVYVGGSIPLF